MIIHCPHDRLVSVKELKAHPQNRNQHPKDQIERLAKILDYQGWRYPIKVSKRSGFITSGHGRLEAAKHLKLKEVPVSFQDYTDEAQEYADLQADNAIASWSELDLSAINTDIGDLGPDFDIDLLGIKDFVIEPADKLDPQCDEDEVPDALPEPKVVRGEVYILGKHRLMCGDSTAITDVERLMNGEKADMVFTDPPYGMNKEIKNDGEEWAEVLQGAFSNCVEIPFQFWFCSSTPKLLHKAMDIVSPDRVIVWHKPFNLSHPQKGFAWHLEFCLYLCFGKPDENRSDLVEMNTIWRKSDPENVGHPTQKPIALFQEITKGIKSKKVLDLFGGSGSTLIACEKTDRQCFMMELDPHYCGVILDRWQKFTGKKAMREDGKLWDELKVQ